MRTIGRKRRALFAIWGIAVAGGLLLGAVTVRADGPPSSDRMRTDEPRRPPQEAFDACRDKSADDPCTVSFRGREIQGKCSKAGGDELVCVPTQPPPPPPEALDACRDKDPGDACTLSFRGRELEGTCFASDAGLLCRPSGPPPPR